jgi:hypothetical protein
MANINISDLSSKDFAEINSQDLTKVAGGDKIIQIFNPFAFFVPNSGNFFGGGGGNGGGNGHGKGHKGG